MPEEVLVYDGDGWMEYG